MTMRTGWLRTLALTALLTGACASVAPPGARNASSAATAARTSAIPTSSPALKVQCPPPSNRCLALVTLRGSNVIVVRDITDIAHAKTVGTLGLYPAPQGASSAMEGALGQFISATEFSYSGGTSDPYFALPTGLFRAPLSGSPKTTVAMGTDAVIAFAWSPDGSTLVYITAGDSGNSLHQFKAGQDRVIASVPPPGLGGGCEVTPCPGPFQNPGDNWDFRLSYSANGARISMVQDSIRSYLLVWDSNGKVLTSIDSEEVSMSVWSGSSLYFRDATGVEVLRDGVISPLLRGVEWIRPKASPDGRYIVYEARQLGLPHVFILDIASGQVRDIGSGRSEPAFLTSRYVWDETEPACVAEGKCGAGFPGAASGPTFIYDLQDGTEARSVITSVVDVWPRGG